MSDGQTREARYYAAVHSDTIQRGARAAMALADEEQADLRAEARREFDLGCEWAARAEDAEARIAAVEAIHQPTTAVTNPWCRADGQTWPCPTTTALRGEQ